LEIKNNLNKRLEKIKKDENFDLTIIFKNLMTS